MSAWPPGVPPKKDLNERLRQEHPWLADDRFGPRNVTAGDCDRCGAEPRLVQTCGPDGGEYGRSCARETDWCDGHADEAADALRYLAALPHGADEVAYLWWLSTGELRYRERYPPLKNTSGGASGRGVDSASTSPSSSE